MQYIIAVLALVVLGVGFTLYQPAPTETASASSSETVAPGKPSNFLLVSEIEKVWEEEEDDEEGEDEGEASDFQPIATEPVVTKIVTPDPLVTALSTPVTTPTPVATPTAPVVTATDYKNGTYIAHTTYKTPDRDVYSMEVSLTIVNDNITNTSITYNNRALRDSYVKRFDSSYQNYVIGEDLGTISLSRIAGASLTTNAFNKAVVSVKTQAGA
ncbi:hypothetical protein GW937_01945 [Candidatus Kaiserbacteria bacterium]|nr:hypothetical protein [Candidatus Kaiserbacteria bacterium]NCT02197.1 hypothetical protein [Candidatus Parcubacteria bacterium]